MAYTKEDIIAEIKAIATKLNKSTLRQIDYAQNSDMAVSTVRYHFGSWNNALVAAGFEALTSEQMTKQLTERNTVNDNVLLKELLILYYKHGKVTYSLISQDNAYSTRPYVKRWGSIQNALDEAIKRANEGLIDVEEDVDFDDAPKEIDNVDVVKIIEDNEITDYAKIKRKPKEIFGQPIDFRGLRFAPINEQGVVYLFGMISSEIGFYIESVRTGFPDCEGKRCFDKKNNLWEHVKIEFEFKSSNFIQHGHDPNGCDVIVCWQNDWVDCPLEVIELKEEIRKLPKTINYG